MSGGDIDRKHEKPNFWSYIIGGLRGLFCVVGGRSLRPPRYIYILNNVII